MKLKCTVILLLIPLLSACQLEKNSHPLAVATATPNNICANDQFNTPIVLSAKGSMAIARLPGIDAENKEHCITRIEWSLADAHYEVLNGTTQCDFECGEDAVECPLTIALAGSSTAQIVLSVQNDLGDTDFAVLPILINNDCSTTELKP